MTDKRFRRLPVGIQSFKVIREENYLYVDKSDIVWNMVNLGEKYNYLSRPRRFGKSVLVDTLESYLKGRKDLFEGLKIMQLEKD
ncbi:AAA family ATPase, partial [Prevotella pectinovora]